MNCHINGALFSQLYYPLRAYENGNKVQATHTQKNRFNVIPSTVDSFIPVFLMGLTKREQT
jgi:hypothetical protein